MSFNIVTLIPELYDAYFNFSVFHAARSTGVFDYRLYNLRDYGLGRHKKIDDYPFGGGKGMILRCEPLAECLDSIEERGMTILFSPAGKTLNAEMAKRFSQVEIVTLINGRYEGLDERIVESYVDEEISVGDFVLTGGDPAALCFMDAVLRQREGFLDSEALDIESFTDGLLEYPQYTRPAEFREMKAPEILLSGDHGKIAEWRHERMLETTRRKRPDLYKKYLEEHHGHTDKDYRGTDEKGNTALSDR